jgi:hypothetical protein
MVVLIKWFKDGQNKYLPSTKSISFYFFNYEPYLTEPLLW